MPEFDYVECKAEFVGLAARGSADQFLVIANLDLDRLAARLGDFIDLGGVTFGRGRQTHRQRRPAAGRRADRHGRRDPSPGSGSPTPPGAAVTEPTLVVAATAAGRHARGQPIRLDAARVAVTAGPDKLTADLLEPVVNLRKTRTGKARVALAGDLGRWRDRVGRFAGLPADWAVGGTGPVEATVAVRDAGVTVERATADITNARFAGAGLTLAEPTLHAEAAAGWDRATGVITLTNAAVRCPTADLTTPTLTVTPTTAGSAVAGTATVRADLGRVQQALGMVPAARGTAAGPVTVTAAGGPTTFDAALTLTDVIAGDPAKPTWREPRVTVTAAGTLDPAADTLTVSRFAVGRDGLAAGGNSPSPASRPPGRWPPTAPSLTTWRSSNPNSGTRSARPPAPAAPAPSRSASAATCPAAAGWRSSTPPPASAGRTSRPTGSTSARPTRPRPSAAARWRSARSSPRSAAGR